MPLDDGRMTETCCGNNIKREEEELLRLPTTIAYLTRDIPSYGVRKCYDGESHGESL
jgi:hypothetical protein